MKYFNNYPLHYRSVLYMYPIILFGYIYIIKSCERQYIIIVIMLKVSRNGIFIKKIFYSLAWLFNIFIFRHKINRRGRISVNHIMYSNTVFDNINHILCLHFSFCFSIILNTYLPNNVRSIKSIGITLVPKNLFLF